MTHPAAVWLICEAVCAAGTSAHLASFEGPFEADLFGASRRCDRD